MLIFAERITKVRKMRKMRQVDVAEQINLNVRTYQSYEGNKKEPTLPYAVKIAKVFGVSLDYLTGLTDELDENFLNSDPNPAIINPK